jgi:phospholipase/carboxylesterase
MTARGWWTTSGPLGQWGRLKVRPAPPVERGPVGLQPLGLNPQRDGLLYVPGGNDPERPAPLVLMLHGANGQAQRGLAPMLDLADAAGLILLAPESRGRTWDQLLGGFGADVEFIDRALSQTFGRYSIDPLRIAVEGFSDGASYALSLGLTNGDLFNRVVAFSPGFLLPGAPRGEPRILISHGIRDQVLPIDACGRKIASMLRQSGYDLTYEEFDGPHTVPPEIARAAVDWLATDNPAS